MRTPWITTRPQTQRRKNEKIFLNRGFRRIRDPQKEKNREEEGNRVYSAMTQVLQRNGFVTSVKKRLNVLRINKKKTAKINGCYTSGMRTLILGHNKQELICRIILVHLKSEPVAELKAGMNLP